ncbi:MAG: MBL fold metallo-hydrolase [Deltaproteobacteria bacterium]|nr:MAG: MBL fold metallo-hydrolase [Deltaproteobacteria bacterium]
MRIMDDLYGFFWASFTENNCNTYLIRGEKNILIDPGHYHLFGHVRDGLERLELSVSDIDVVLVTHGHLDHMEGVNIFKDGSAIYGIHKEEWDLIKKGPSYHMGVFASPDISPQILLKEGELVVGDKRFKILHTPGHSPGSICIYWPEKRVLFSGDCVFEEGIGRTDLPGGNGEELKESIRNISQLDTWYLLPGHGDMVVGRDEVNRNFKQIEELWFSLL